MQSTPGSLVILGTGGTIAGTATSPQEHVAYAAAQLGVAALVAAVPALRGLPLQAEQLAQLDSADMSHGVWQRLAGRVAVHLQRPEVEGLVVTHGTDTLEESAYFLHRVLAPAKPVVFTAAMRPATALQADGPQNLLDAVTLAGHPGARGVLVVIAGRVFAGAEIRKTHPYRLDAFDAGDRGALGVIEQGMLRRWRDWPAGDAIGLETIARSADAWPRVEIVSSHAGSDGRIVDALLDQGVDGLVVAGVGNGHVHVRLREALQRAVARGVGVLVCTRCAQGAIVGAPPETAALTPAQGRIELMFRLLASSLPAA